MIVPSAGAPAVVGLMTGLPGWFAVLARSAVSVTGFPKSTGPDPAWVTSVGCLGVTLKHSPPVASVAFGTPCVAEVKSPRQQYRPAEVIVAAAEMKGTVVP